MIDTTDKSGDRTNEVGLRLESWTLRRIADAVDGELMGASGEESVQWLSTDTREIGDGALFVALVGERFDAHEFVGDAYDAGARSAIVHKEGLARELDRPIIIVDDTLAALQNLGRALWQEASDEGLRSVALTGSNGKTTVKEMAAALLARSGATFATPGNLNNHIGVPLTLCALPHQAEFLVLEMGANAPGDIEELIALAPGHTRVITSIGAAHLEGFGDLDGVRRGKSEIFSRSQPGHVAIVPHGERDRLNLRGFAGEVLTVGEDRDADIRLSAFDTHGGRPRARYDVAGESLELRVPIPGRHHAFNLGTALGVLVSQGLELDADEIQGALDGLELPAGRWREETAAEIRFIDDAYNANPTSTVASFDAFMQIEDSRDRVAVLGEMLELGESARERHMDVARHVAEATGLDALLAVGPFADDMVDAASRSVEAHSFETAEQAGDWLVARESSGDGILVFLKGSRGARLEGVIERARQRSDVPKDARRQHDD